MVLRRHVEGDGETRQHRQGQGDRGVELLDRVLGEDSGGGGDRTGLQSNGGARAQSQVEVARVL